MRGSGDCRFTPRAVQDLNEILEYIAEDKPGAAARMIDRLEEQCHLLAEIPEMGRQRNELAPGLRSFALGSYVIFYRSENEGVEIIRVLHGARDIPEVLEIG